MSLPYFPLYPSDFEAKTSHLTLEEDGAYNRLLRLSWMTPGCSLPDDPAWISRRMRVDMATYERLVAPLIEEFFTRSKGRITNAKLTGIFNESTEKHSRRVEAGKLGGRPPKSPQINEKKQSNAKAMPKQPEPEPEPEPEEVKREAKASPKKTEAHGTRLPQEWFLPMDLGEWALSQGMTRDEIRSEADKFRDYWVGVAGAKGRKADWPATWRNWVRKFIAENARGRKNGNGHSNGAAQGSKRPDAALAQIARLTGLDGASGDGGFGVGSAGEEAGPLWMGQRPQ